MAETIWYTQAGAGTNSGANLANAKSAAQFNTSGTGTGFLDAGDTGILSGTFTSVLTIQNSGGSATNRVNLVSDGSAVVVGINGTSKNYIGVFGVQFTQTSTSNNYFLLTFSNSSGWLLQDNNLTASYYDGFAYAAGTNSNNIFRRNTFNNLFQIDLGSHGNKMITLIGNNNLAEYNTFGVGLDRIKFFGTGNVIRNNYDSGTGDVDSIYTNSSPYPYHTDTVQIDLEGGVVSTKICIDRNFVKDNYSPSHNGHFVIIQDDTNSGITQILTRQNVLARIAETGMLTKYCSRVGVYNNTWVKLQNNAANTFQAGITYDLGTGDIFDYRNNTFYECRNCLDSGGIITTANRPTNFTSGTNHVYNASGGQPTLPSGASPANLSATDPLFTNPGSDDYTLQVTSPLKGTGTAITTATNSGSGSTSLTVGSGLSKRFFDGFGTTTDADWIKIGSGAYVKISSINYATDTITLSAARTWSSSDSIFLAGTEDVGALPYGSGTVSITGTPTYSGSVFTVVATNARCVEILGDGVPLGRTDAATYNGNETFSVTITGSASVYTARAYSLWASQTLIAEATASAAGSTISSLLGNLTLKGQVTIL